MEITKSNFKDVFPKVKEAIEECDFLAIDTELTGLHDGEQQKANSFDTMDERYSKLNASSKGFLIIQFGISCFRYNSDSNKYTHKDFNFYIFPRPFNRIAPDSIFVCQPSSLVYLSSHNFDFNKLISEGIPYMMPHDEQKFRSFLKTKYDEANHSKLAEKNNGMPRELKSVNVPDEHKDFIKDTHEKINVFLSNKSQAILNLPPCSAYKRKLIYQTVNERALPGLDLSTAQNSKNQNFIAIIKTTYEEKLKKLQMKQLADTWELDEAVGFRTVLDVISSSKKLIIGHNMLLDIIHTIDQFFHPLPEDLREFKEMIKCIFPRILDTKTLSSSAVFKETIDCTALSDLFLELKKNMYKADIEAADGFQCYNVDMDRMHEAGFDAFVTGFCFVQLATFIDKKPVSANSTSLTPYINRPFIMRHFDMKSLNLNGPDPQPKRDHVFFVSFPKEWKTLDLIELFLPYGGVSVHWVSDTSAFVALKDSEQSINVKKKLLKQFNSLYRVRTYSEYRDALKSSSQQTYSHGTHTDLIPNKKNTSRSSSAISAATRTISPILEEDEVESSLVSTSLDRNASEKTKASGTDTPKAKKQKVCHEESEADEVSSTEKIFEESSDW